MVTSTSSTSSTSLTSSTNSAGSTPATAAPAANSSQSIGGQFMNLLVAQLKNQDPLNPMDPTAMTAQLTQLSSLQQLESINAALGSLGSSKSTQSALAEASTALGKTARVSLGSDGSTAFSGDGGALHFDFGSAAPAGAKLVQTDANGTVVGTWPISGASGDVNVGKIPAGAIFRVDASYSDGKTDSGHSGSSMLSQSILVKSVTLNNGAAYIVDSLGHKAPWGLVVGLS